LNAHNPGKARHMAVRNVSHFGRQTMLSASHMQVASAEQELLVNHRCGQALMH